jgi:Alkylmercury lyase
MIRPSPHALRTAYGVVHTQCSVDALGIPSALRIAAEIEDSCPTCHRTITATVSADGQVHVNPIEAVISMAKVSATCSDGGLPTMCMETNFFCSVQHAMEWRQSYGTLPATHVSAQEAASLGKSIWRDIAPI